MRRLLLPLVLITFAWPAAANASVLSSLSGGTLTVTGDGADDRITVRSGGPGTVLVNDERFDGVSAVEIRSGGGADVISGSSGAETIVAGDGADLVDGGGGADTVLLGAGDDTALTSDGSVDGQSGADSVRVSGTDAGEELTLQALGGHALVTQELGARADLVRVEALEVLARGGADLVDVGDLSTTELTRIDADLGRLDGASDSVFVAGTDGNDGLAGSMLEEAIRVSGLKADVRIEHADGDRVTVQARGGDDKLTAVGGVPGLALEGNDGADDLTGAAGDETLRGGPGNDRVRGNGGADRVELGEGDDTATLRLADGADTISGDGGTDRLAVQGTSADETIDVRATQVGAAKVDGVETLAPAPGNGTDTVAVGDVSGSAIKTVAVDLGGPDQRVDTVAVTGTAGPDKVKVAANGTGHVVTGLPATVTVDTTDPGQKVVIDGGTGDDQVDASGMTKDKTQPFLLGGPGKDVLVGSPGQDVVTGGADADVAFLAGGLDTFTWAAGDGNDIVEGGAGTDFLRLDGTEAGDSFAVSPIGGRSRVGVNAELIDLGGLERLDVLPAGGADQIHVGDMSGTATDHVDLLLTKARGTVVRDDGRDSVFLDGSNGADSISVTAAGPTVRTEGLAAITTVHFGDKTQDSLLIDTKLGNDLVSVAPTVFNQLQFSSF